MIERVLFADTFWVLAFPFWSTVVQTAADTHRKLLDHVASGASVLLRVCLSVTIEYRRSVAVLYASCRRSGVTRCTLLMVATI